MDSLYTGAGIGLAFFLFFAGAALLYRVMDNSKSDKPKKKKGVITRKMEL